MKGGTEADQQWECCMRVSVLGPGEKPPGDPGVKPSSIMDDGTALVSEIKKDI